jgi:hypothetical protein
LNSDGVEIFLSLTARALAPLIPLYNGYRFLLGGRKGGKWCWPPAPLYRLSYEWFGA